MGSQIFKSPFPNEKFKNEDTILLRSFHPRNLVCHLFAYVFIKCMAFMKKIFQARIYHVYVYVYVYICMNMYDYLLLLYLARYRHSPF